MQYNNELSREKKQMFIDTKVHCPLIALSH